MFCNSITAVAARGCECVGGCEEPPLTPCLHRSRAWDTWRGVSETSASVASLKVEAALGDALTQVAQLQAKLEQVNTERLAHKRTIVSLQRQLLKPYVFGDGAASSAQPAVPTSTA